VLGFDLGGAALLACAPALPKSIAATSDAVNIDCLVVLIGSECR